MINLKTSFYNLLPSTRKTLLEQTISKRLKDRKLIIMLIEAAAEKGMGKGYGGHWSDTGTVEQGRYRVTVHPSSGEVTVLAIRVVV